MSNSGIVGLLRPADENGMLQTQATPAQLSTAGRGEDRVGSRPETHCLSDLILHQNSVHGEFPVSKSYSVPLYRRIRVFERDGWKCAYCGCALTLDLIVDEDREGICVVPVGFQRATVDHIIPRSQGGNHKDDNLTACCVSCNSRKGVKPAHVMQAARA